MRSFEHFVIIGDKNGKMFRGGFANLSILDYLEQKFSKMGVIGTKRVLRRGFKEIWNPLIQNHSAAPVPYVMKEGTLDFYMNSALLTPQVPKRY